MLSTNIVSQNNQGEPPSRGGSTLGFLGGGGGGGGLQPPKILRNFWKDKENIHNELKKL